MTATVDFVPYSKDGPTYNLLGLDSWDFGILLSALSGQTLHHPNGRRAAEKLYKELKKQYEAQDEQRRQEYLRHRAAFAAEQLNQ